jgi:hypothetical protein
LPIAAGLIALALWPAVADVPSPPPNTNSPTSPVQPTTSGRVFQTFPPSSLLPPSPTSVDPSSTTFGYGPPGLPRDLPPGPVVGPPPPRNPNAQIQRDEDQGRRGAQRDQQQLEGVVERAVAGGGAMKQTAGTRLESTQSRNQQTMERLGLSTGGQRVQDRRLLVGN